MIANVVVGGVPKAGTTSLYRYLLAHPNVAGSAVKETCYFIDPDHVRFNPAANFATHGIGGYHQFFSHIRKGDAELVCEATPDYLYQESAVRGLGSIEPLPRVIFLLRNPSLRLYSLYRFAQNSAAVLPEAVSFAQYLDMIFQGSSFLRDKSVLRDGYDQGRYIDYLERWDEVFGERMILRLFEDMVASPREFMLGLAGELGLDPTPYRSSSFGVHNPTKNLRNQGIHRLYRRLKRILPTGMWRKPGSVLYRRLNFRTQSRIMTEEECDSIRELDRLYEPSNELLASRFRLDLTTWRAERAEPA